MPTSHIFDAFDLPILRFLTGFSGEHPLFDHLVNALSRMDLFKGMALMCLFWYIWAKNSADKSGLNPEQRRDHLVFVLLGTILIGGLSRALQLVLKIHQRPVLSDLGLTFPIPDFDSHNLNTWNSFPSDHSMFFIALATGLWTVNRAAGLAAFVWTIVIIDLPRIYLGIHYPSDVVFGVLFGFVAMRAFLALPLRRIRRHFSAWRHDYPGLAMAALFFATDEVGHLLAEFRDVLTSLHVLLH